MTDLIEREDMNRHRSDPLFGIGKRNEPDVPIEDNKSDVNDLSNQLRRKPFSHGCMGAIVLCVNA